MNLIDLLFYLAPFVGGITLILGAYFLYKGKALYSLFFYLIADLCWVLLAIQTKNIFGSITILIGIVFSLGVFYKMNSGIFVTDLHKDKG